MKKGIGIFLSILLIFSFVNLQTLHLIPCIKGIACLPENSITSAMFAKIHNKIMMKKHHAHKLVEYKHCLNKTYNLHNPDCSHCSMKKANSHTIILSIPLQIDAPTTITAITQSHKKIYIQQNRITEIPSLSAHIKFTRLNC